MLGKPEAAGCAAGSRARRQETRSQDVRQRGDSRRRPFTRLVTGVCPLGGVVRTLRAGAGRRLLPASPSARCACPPRTHRDCGRRDVRSPWMSGTAGCSASRDPVPNRSSRPVCLPGRVTAGAADRADSRGSATQTTPHERRTPASANGECCSSEKQRRDPRRRRVLRPREAAVSLVRSLTTAGRPDGACGASSSSRSQLARREGEAGFRGRGSFRRASTVSAGRSSHGLTVRSTYTHLHVEQMSRSRGADVAGRAASDEDRPRDDQGADTAHVPSAAKFPENASDRDSRPAPSGPAEPEIELERVSKSVTPAISVALPS
jgi:hypothetical protein